MATYNGGRFLEEQLRSIAQQTVLPCELLIHDDLSTDYTLDIVERFARSAPFPVRVHRNEQNVGFIRNFRASASRCIGDLIAFCDQDDWWDPQRVERCVARFEHSDLLLLYHNAWLVDETRRKIGVLYDAQHELRALKVRPFAPWHWCNGLLQVFRADLRQFDDLWGESISQFSEGIVAHDRWYFFLAQALGRVEFLDQPLVEYRQHQFNTYGAWQTRTFGNSLLARMAHDADQDVRFARAAESRGRILKELARRLPAELERLVWIGDKYMTLAERYARRAQSYTLPSFSARLANLWKGWCSGDYTEWPWGFDKRSVVRDLTGGVLLGK